MNKSRKIPFKIYPRFHLRIGERNTRIESLLFTRPSFKSNYLAIFPNVSIAHFPIRSGKKIRASCAPLTFNPSVHTCTDPSPPEVLASSKVNGFDRGTNSREIVLHWTDEKRTVVADETNVEKSVVRRHVFFSPILIPLRSVQWRLTTSFKCIRCFVVSRQPLRTKWNGNLKGN